MADPGPFDSLLPPAMAERAEQVGARKADQPALDLFFLALLAGAFIGLGAMFFTVTMTGVEEALPWGPARLLGGLAFCLGLILVVVGGAELFTGDNLMVMAAVSRRLRVRALLRVWGIVYAGNFAGAVATALMILSTAQHELAGGRVGWTALAIADAKCGLGPVEAVMRGVYCNALVCLAVWLTFSCRTTADRILAILFPITAFVAAGFEHSVANMYFIPLALFIQQAAPASFWQELGQLPDSFQHLSWSGFFLKNLLPVTIGNVIGGGLFVGLVYWLVYRRRAGRTV